MVEPPLWSAQQLREDADVARERFRSERLDEPLELYTQLFDAFLPIFDRLIGQFDALASDELDPELLPTVMGNPDTRMAFRYLTAPPISEDDLRTLADAKLSPSALRSDPASARRVRNTVLHILDPKRFPWFAEGRDPDAAERRIAAVASAALATAQRVQTQRRSDAKSTQEAAVRTLLRDIGFTQVARRAIQNLHDAPGRGEFCPESKLGGTRADVVVGLYDRRMLALECKVSNSEVNSFKRVNHEAAGKARAWLDEFGRRQVVPAAVLSGVFKPTNLESAQEQHLGLFWLHRLDDLREFIQATND